MIAASEFSGSKYLIWLSFIVALFVQAGLGALLWQVCGTDAEISRKIVPLVYLKLQPNFAIQPPVLSQTVNKAEPKQVLPPLPATIKEVTMHEPSLAKQEPVKMPPDEIEPQHPQPKIKQQAQQAKKQPQKQVAKKLENQPDPRLKSDVKPVAEKANVALPVDTAVQKIDAVSKKASINDIDTLKSASTKSANPHSQAVPVRRIEHIASETDSVLSQPKNDPVADAKSDTPIVSKAMQDEFSRYLARIRKQLEKNKKYPDNARRKRIEGNVLVSFSILSDGQIVGAEVTNGAAVELSEAALALLRDRKFAAPPSGWQSGNRIEFTINYNLR